MNPGEYPSPLPRKTLVNVPVVSGYVTSRLMADDAIAPVTSGEDTRVNVLFENVGNTNVSVLLRQTNDRSISGTRINVISGIALVPGGRRYVTTTEPFLRFLELYTYDGGPSQVRMQIESLRKWDQCGFDKVADQTFYPPSLWQTQTAYPQSTALPSAITPNYNYP
jgi:hypothetical protein